MYISSLLQNNFSEGKLCLKQDHISDNEWYIYRSYTESDYKKITHYIITLTTSKAVIHNYVHVWVFPIPK